MNDNSEKKDNRPTDEESAPTASIGPGMGSLGEQIGRYKLLRILGEGGFGIVYLAEQQRPMKRQVALKIIKPGMDSAQIIRRFEAERQALALIDHPNVAHVYDAGTNEAGRPYFVMEYVKGVPITEHCDRQRLTIEERLKLFMQVCEAIQHAHQKGIIHRDIKPSNIQVCIQGKQAIPKVIDFGVAKALSQPLTERTLVTEQGQLIGTPEYISPEQAEMTNQDIDTRADIYSLGVLLYELLTGTLPFESQTLRRGSLEQMRQILRDTEPRTPSTRVSALDAETCSKVARCCQSDVVALRRKLRGDLDWITLKAMEKDRMRRYQTAHALAEDIERHLNNEPVLAGRPGTLYRFKKLVRRNKGVFMGLAAVAIVLVLGAIVSTWQAIRATQAEQAESRLRQEAQANELAMRRIAYDSDMSLVQQALATNDLGRALRLLDAHRPGSGQVDLRGWEWRYLWEECQSSDAISEVNHYPGSTKSVAYSPDGKVLAVAGFTPGFIDIWDVPNRRRIKTLQPKEGFLVAFSPRGDLLATNAGSQIRLWRVGTWDMVDPSLTLGGTVRVLKFSPDETRLASLSYPDQLTVWDTEQRSIVFHRGVRLAGAHIGALDFSPDGKTLVVGDADHHLRVFDLASGNTDVNIPDAHSEGITAVAWSPDGSIIVSGSGYIGGPIRLWDSASGKSLGSLEGHNSWICKLIFSRDSQLLYSASGDQTIRIWDIDQRKCRATLRGSTDEVYGLALSPDGTTLASASKNGIIAFWDASPHPEKEQPRIIDLGQLIMPSVRTLPAFAPDGRILAVPRAGTVSLLDLATLKEIEQIPELGASVWRIHYSPNGTLLVSGGKSGKIRVWSCTEHRLLKTLEDPNGGPIYPLGFRKNGRRLLSVSPPKIIVWDTLTWQRVRTLEIEIELNPIPKLSAISPDSRLMAIGTPIGSVYWLNIETGKLLAPSNAIHQPGVSGIALSDDGSRAASVDEGGTIAIWDMSLSKPKPIIPPFKGHMLGAHGVVISPNGRRLATGSNGREAVKLWDLSTFRELLTLPGQGSLFSFVAFSPDGKWLAACNNAGQLHLWHAPSWDQIEAAESKPDGTQFP
jgi:WD40 repeat protein/serine/threonine protein kinase